MTTTPATQTQPLAGWQRLRHGLASGLMAIMAIAMVGLFTGCEGPEPYAEIPPDVMSSRPTGTLSAGDVIQVSYPGAPELNTTQRIQMNGRVSLPKVGDVSASGKSVASLQSQLTGMYTTHLQNPTVLVAVETAAAGVYVSGEVMKPGKIPLDRPMTAFEAVMEAGGFSKFANRKQVVVVRNQGGKHQRYALNLDDTLSGMNHNAFYLRPYDTVFVKQSRW
jgi:polysaccharide biosynthesis/export protein